MKVKFTFLLALLILSLFISFQTFSQVSNSGYIENKGQIYDQYRKPNLDVLFLCPGMEVNIHLKKHGFSYESFKRIENVNQSQTPVLNSLKAIIENAEIMDEKTEKHIHRIDIEFLGADNNVEIIPLEKNDVFQNFYNLGSVTRGVTDVCTYSKVLYRNLYPGIDLLFEMDANTKPKYNFIIHPGADANLISWKYKGADNINLDAGRITLENSNKDIVEYVPYSYFKESEISVLVRYQRLDNGSFKFDFPTYSDKLTLVIDPAMWGTYFGGTGYDMGTDICQDPSGNLFICGNTDSNAQLATSGVYQTTLHGWDDAYIARFTEEGNLVWASYFGDSGSEYFYAICCDQNTHLYAYGRCHDSDSLATPGAEQTVCGGGDYDSFLASFDSTGCLNWSTFLGGSQNEYPWDIVADEDNNVYVVGTTNSIDSIGTIGSPQPSFAGITDGYMVKYNQMGSRIWGRYIGGAYMDEVQGIDYSDGRIVITGLSSSSSGISTPGVFQDTLLIPNSVDAIVMLLDTSGTKIWGTYTGGTSYDIGKSVAFGHEWDIYVFGETYSTSHIATPGTHKDTLTGLRDFIIQKFDVMGQKEWGTYYGGDYSEDCGEVKIDDDQNIYVTGFSRSANGIATPGAFQDYNLQPDCHTPGVLAKFTTNGILIWATYFGHWNAVDNSMVMSLDYWPIVSGTSMSSINISTPGAYKTYPHFRDAFIMKFNQHGQLYVIENNSITADQEICNGMPLDSLYGDTAMGGGDTISYQWIYSCIDSISGYNPILINGNSLNLNPNFINTTSWFRRIATTNSAIDTSNAVSIVVYDSIATISSLPYIEFCEGDSVLLSCDTESIINYSWFLNGAIVPIQSDSQLVVSESAECYLVAENNFGCIDTSQLITIVMQNIPQVGSISGPSANLNTATSYSYEILPQSNITYDWSVDSGTILNGQGTNQIQVQWSALGTYNIIVHLSNMAGCSDSASMQISVQNILTMNELDNQNIHIFPNPTHRLLHIKGLSGNEKIEVFNVLGKLIHVKPTAGADLTTLNLNTCPDGVYFIHIAYSASSTVFKIMKN